ncbi:MAG TPA: DinB family protein [Bryobacteraceae bacterium]|nr:DinB family protein [Bryobacteraceae bacterium]
MKISDALLPEFDQEMANTRKTLDRVPEDKFGWRPHPKSFTMISLATHIANMVGWTVDTIAKDSFDIAPPGAPPYKEELAGSRKELLDKFDKGVTAARAAIAGASDQHLMASWSLLSGGQPIFTMPRIACVRSMIMNHVIHHRAQLGVYLRLNDIPVPATYGPSADES